MNRAFARLVVTGALAGATMIASAPAMRAQTAGAPIHLRAWAVSMANVATGANAVVEIRVDKWSPATERDQLINTFLDKGQDELLKALQKLPIKGRIRIPGRTGPDPQQTALGWNLRYAMESPGEDGGKRILIATDRVMSFAEVRNQPRTVDYPFTFIEIHLNPDGKGEGKMAVATQLKFEKKTNSIVFENYSTEPVRLNEVEIQK